MIPRRRIPVSIQHALVLLQTQQRDQSAITLFETALAEYLDIKGVVCFPSGRAAMLAAVRSIPKSTRKQVVLPAYTLATLADLIRAEGYEVVFADVCDHTYNITPKTLEPVLSDQTHMVIVADIFGNPAPIRELHEMTKRAGAFLLEDAAHALGAKRSDQSVGTMADATFFSFDTIKPVCAYGGGALVSNDENLIDCVKKHVPTLPEQSMTVWRRYASNVLERLLQKTPAYPLGIRMMNNRVLRNRILDPYLLHRDTTVPAEDRGWLPAQADIALQQLKTIQERIERKQRLARHIEQALKGLISFQKESPDSESNRYFLVGMPSFDSNALSRQLINSGIDVGKHEEICDFAPPQREAESFPNAWRLYNNALQLPCDANLTESQVQFMLKTIRKVVEKIHR